MMSKFIFKAFKISLSLGMMTFVGTVVLSEDIISEEERIELNRQRDEMLYSRFTHLNPASSEQWQNISIQMFNALGVVAHRTNILGLSQWLSLWGMSNLDTLRPDFELFRSKIRYWQGQMGPEELNQFIQNTPHNNPYHLLAVDLERWQAMTAFMQEVGLFSTNPSEQRSLNWFLLTHSWAEGAVTSRKADKVLWLQWTELFRQVLQDSNVLSDYFSVVYYENQRNHDFIQRVYISLSKDLYKAVKDYTHLLSPQILVDFIDPKHTYMHSSFVSDLQDTLELLNQMIVARQKINGVLMTADFAKTILLGLLYKVYSDPSLTRSGYKFENAIYQVHTSQSQNMCSQFLFR